MNVVYLLTNLSKKTEPRNYIGSKVECDILPVFGIPSIVSLKSGSIYLGSSSNKEMKQDLLAGDKFRAEVLEVVSDRNLLRKKEAEWLLELDVANNSKYYNLSNNALASYKYYDMSAAANSFGETYTKVSKSRGSIGRRNVKAKSLGFKDFYDLIVFIAKKLQQGWSSAAIARSIGEKNRHFPIVTTRSFNLNKLLQENPADYTRQVEDFYFANATLEKTAELLGIEVPTAYRATLLLVGSFEKPDTTALVVARKLNTSVEELEISLFKKILQTELSLPQIAYDFGFDRRSATKYLMRFLRRRFKVSDFE